MKSLMLSAAIALSSFAATASDTKGSKILSYRANENLFLQFGEVENVQWRPALNNMVRADFNVNDESVTAFFASDGEFIASTKNITRNQLPVRLRKEFDKKVGDAEITKMFELNSAVEHCYFVETIVEGKVKIWKGTDYGSMQQYRKEY
jgi:hypothetical protein